MQTVSSAYGKGAQPEFERYISLLQKKTRRILRYSKVMQDCYFNVTVIIIIITLGSLYSAFSIVSSKRFTQYYASKDS